MISFLSIILVLIFLIIVPFILGLLGERVFDRTGENILFSRCFLMGFALMLAVFQLIAPFMIYKGTSFDILLGTYVAVIAVIVALSLLVVNRKTFVKAVLNGLTSIKNEVICLSSEYKIIGALALAFIIFQTSLLVFRTHMDTDDCRFLAEALEAVERNTLLRCHPITGIELYFPVGEMTKDMTSPYPLFISVVSVLTRLHPAVLAHNIFPVLLIPLCYMACFLLSTYFFSDTNKRMVFMLVLSITVLFSFESIYAWGYTLLTIIWQGRSIAAVIMLPLMWYLLELIYTDNINTGYIYILICIVGLANADLSGMGALMAPIVVGIFAVSNVISSKMKKLRNSVYMILSIIPCGVFSILFKILEK